MNKYLCVYLALQIMDMHLAKLAPLHPETRFVKINAEKSPFICERLRVFMLPTLAIVINNEAGTHSPKLLEN